jgi:hypothetical protein
MHAADIPKTAIITPFGLWGFLRILKPLTDVLRGSPGSSIALEWSDDMAAAFTAVKAALCKTVNLAHPSPTTELALMVDASAEHVGASLQQRAALGSRLVFSLKNLSWLKPATLHSTVSYGPVSLASGIPATYWRAGNSHSSQITSR